MLRLRINGRWRRKLWILLGCAITAVVILTFWLNREPRYDGQMLSEWVSLLESDSNHAQAALREMGPNALPFLIEWIQYQEPPWRRRLGTLCDRLPDRFGGRLNEFVVGKGYERQQGAFSALYILGPKAAPAIPTLVHLVETQPLTIQASMTVLAQIGGNGLTPVLHVLTDQTSPYRLAAINALADPDFNTERPLNPIVVSALTNCLNDRNRELAFCAAQILCFHDSQKEFAMRMLVDALGADDKALRRNATARVRISLRRGYSVPALLQYLQDGTSPLSAYAAGALGELAAAGTKLPESVLPGLTNSLHDARPLVREYAASAVRYFGEAAVPAAPALLDLWNDPNYMVRQSATNAFFELPAFRALRDAPYGISLEQADMLERRYGVPLCRVVLTNLFNYPDARIREMATNAFRTHRRDER